MKRISIKPNRRFLAIGLGLIISFLLSLSVFAAPLNAWSNGQPAEVVLGQPDFSTNSIGTTSSKFNYSYDIAIDSANGKVFISEYNNHRILRFDSVDAMTSGAAAEAVLGQADFTSGSANRGGAVGVVAANTLFQPMGICIDSGGRLWVADNFNNRVLAFDNASSKADGANADRVFGQADFTSGFPNRGGPKMWDVGPVAANSLQNPTDVSCDPSGRLWVVDSDNSRVLRFDNITGKPNGANADGVLGQPDFVSSAAAISQNGVNRPIGVTYTPGGELFLSDWQNHRVLRFDNAASKADGANADGVLGQADFTSNVQATTQTGMRYSRGVEVDRAGTLFVSESSNHRVLLFNDAANKANGGPADLVLGQADFTSGITNRGGAAAANTVNSPRLLYYDRNTDFLWLADQGNNRVLRWSDVSEIFSDTIPTPTADPPESLPPTGFSPGEITSIKEQSVENDYLSFENDLLLEIPDLDISASIVGVPRSDESWNVTWLDDQVGWLEDTAFPTWSGNSVLTAHVVDANGEPGLFTNLQDLKWGDRITIKAWGQDYVYEVRSINKEVHPNDISQLEHEDFPWLTLVTCKGFNEEYDNYRWRVVVKAIQVNIK